MARQRIRPVALVSLLPLLALLAAPDLADPGAADLSLPPSDAVMLHINEARLRAGRPALRALPPLLQGLARDYGRRVALGLIVNRSCDHDLAAWKTLMQQTAQRGKMIPIGEVLCCPWPAGEWQARDLVEEWIRSPSHKPILLQRPWATHLSCETVTANGMTAAVCNTWMVTRP